MVSVQIRQHGSVAWQIRAYTFASVSLGMFSCVASPIETNGSCRNCSCVYQSLLRSAISGVKDRWLRSNRSGFIELLYYC